MGVVIEKTEVGPCNNPAHVGVYRELRGDGRYGVWCGVCNLWLRWEFPLAEFTPEMEAKVREVIRDEASKLL